MKPHISELKIEAFRGLKSLELRELGQFNLLFGYNNSGKSSILESIEYFCRPADPLALINLSRRREVSMRNLDPVQTLRWLFPKDERTADGDFFDLKISVSGAVAGVRRTIETTLGGRLVDVYVSRPVNADGSEPDPHAPTTTSPLTAEFQKTAVDLKFLYYEGNHQDELLNVQTTGYTMVEGSPFSMHSPVATPTIPCSALSPVTHRVDSSQTKGISNIIKGKRKNDLLAVVGKLDGQISDIVILENNGYPEVWVDHRDRGFMPLSAFGDGLRRVLAIASGLTSAEGGILLIDEIETAIHKDALQKVFRWLREASDELKIQVVASTHSLEAIDAMLVAEENATDEVVAYRLPTPDSKERFTRFSGESLLDLRFVGGMEVR